MSKQNKNNNLCTDSAGIMSFLLSYCGLVDGKIRASDKDLPVLSSFDFQR